ncbi:MAG: hypothetical protein IJR52_07135, partial [Selenomonadaceae bacterium]|nr:hypothetical protein [Selenomonadaceae bacterium]
YTTINAGDGSDTIDNIGVHVIIDAGDDSIQMLGTGTLTGSTGEDNFIVNGSKALTISDYEEGEKISLTAGTADSTTDGDDLIFNGKVTVAGGANKNVIYIDEAGEHTIEPSPEPTPTPNPNFDVSTNGKTIILRDTYLDDSFDIDNYDEYKNSVITIDASAIKHSLEIVGNKLANSITGTGEDDFIDGQAGSDTFVYDGNGSDTVTDYSEEDLVKISKGSVKKISKTSAGSVVFIVGKSKLTLKDVGDKVIAYEDAEGVKQYYPVDFSEDGTSVKLLSAYGKDSFDVNDYDEYKSSVEIIDASKVKHELNITGNKLANSITGTGEDDFIDGQAGSDNLIGGKGNDSIWGGVGNDTIFGGKGADVFIYYNGDGKDVIEDYDPTLDTIMVLSGEIKSTKTNAAGDVIFKIGSGQILVAGATDKIVTLVDPSGNRLSRYNPN